MSLKNKLLNRKNVYGTWININNILIPEILSQANFDWFCIDLEHSGIDYNDVVNLIISSENSKCTPLVRVQENNESINEPKTPEKVFFGLILVNFFHLSNLPKT